MSFEMILLISGLFLSGAAVYIFSASLLSSNAESEALALASSDDDEESALDSAPLLRFSKPIVHNLVIQHARKLKFSGYRKTVQQKIIYSGLSKDLSVDEFIGIQMLWGLFFPAFALFLNFALQLNYPLWVFAGIIGFGSYFPHFYCKSMADKRQKSVERDLPFFIDLLSLSTEAGLDFMGSIQKITEKADKDSVLASEFLIVLKDIKLGSSRSEALGKLNERIKSASVKSFVTMVQDSDETGASIAKTLKAKSDQMRVERFNKAEQEGAKASQKILIPMILFIVPAVLVTVFGPVALSFYYGG